MGSDVIKTVKSLTDIGKMREENQDSLGWKELAPDLHVLIVADGMGGYAGGSVASTTVTETMLKEFESTPPDGIREKPSLHIRKAINAGNAAVNAKAEKNREFKDMGSTVVCCLVIGNQLHTAHVGDSRAYLLRENQIKLITEDHTVVQDLVRGGYVSAEDASYHPSSGILTKCLGQMEISDPEFSPVIELEEGDCVLLCSDGLSGMLDDDELGEIMLHEPESKAINILVDFANEAGGFDNITAILFYYGKRPADARSMNIRVGNPFYEDIHTPETSEPTIPYRIQQKGREKLRNTMFITTEDPVVNKSPALKNNWVLPVIITFIILLLGFLIWLAGGIPL